VSLIIGAVIGAIAGFLVLAIVLAVISLFESDQTALGWTWILTFPAVLLGGIVGAGWSLIYVSNLSDKST
jgi:ABC-type polysaccharide/polyol phosphate export permease